MVLNEKQRKKYRWLLSEDGIAKLTFAKGLLPIIGGQIFLKLLPSSLDDITGIQKPVCFIIGLLAFLLVIFGIGLILYAVFILPLLFKAKNKKFEKKYPVSKNRMSRRKLFRAAEAMNENPDSRMRTEVDGDWIEFSLEMENYLPNDEVDDFIDCQTYRRLIHIGNDGTYSELEYLDKDDGSEPQIGLVKEQKIGYHLNDDGITRRYEFDKEDLTRTIHRWLANRGYKHVGKVQ